MTTEAVLTDDVASLRARVAALEDAIRPLIKTLIKEFGDGAGEPDEASVYVGVPDGEGLTFGMLRKAWSALDGAQREMPIS